MSDTKQTTPAESSQHQRAPAQRAQRRRAPAQHAPAQRAPAQRARSDLTKTFLVVAALAFQNRPAQRRRVLAQRKARVAQEAKKAAARREQELCQKQSALKRDRTELEDAEAHLQEVEALAASQQIDISVMPLLYRQDNHTCQSLQAWVDDKKAELDQLVTAPPVPVAPGIQIPPLVRQDNHTSETLAQWVEDETLRIFRAKQELAFDDAKGKMDQLLLGNSFPGSSSSVSN